MPTAQQIAKRNRQQTAAGLQAEDPTKLSQDAWGKIAQMQQQNLAAGKNYTPYQTQVGATQGYGAADVAPKHNPLGPNGPAPKAPKPQAAPGATTPPPPPATPPPPQSTTDLLDSMFGAGASKIFGPYFGDKNPLETAKALSQQQMGDALGGIRTQMAGAGLGNSSRNALMQGDAAARFNTQLADVLGQRGQDQARLALEALIGGGNQNLQGQQLDLTRLGMLNNVGTATTGIGASEQSMPNIQAAIEFLSQFGRATTTQKGKQTSHTGSGFLA